MGDAQGVQDGMSIVYYVFQQMRSLSVVPCQSSAGLRTSRPSQPGGGSSGAFADTSSGSIGSEQYRTNKALLPTSTTATSAQSTTQGIIVGF